MKTLLLLASVLLGFNQEAAPPGGVEEKLKQAAELVSKQDYDGAIALYGKVIAEAPKDPRGYLERGHRYLNTRRFAEGAADLRKADALAPNSIEVAYHLALSYYFAGHFKEAAKIYQQCLGAPETKQTGVLKPCGADRSDPGARAGMTDWAYRALRRSGDVKAARQLVEQFPEGLKLDAGTDSYYRTIRFYKGALTEDQVLEGLETVYFAGAAYGVANFHLMEGHADKGCSLLKRLLEDKEGRFGWGYVAAEIELKKSCAGR